MTAVALAMLGLGVILMESAVLNQSVVAALNSVIAGTPISFTKTPTTPTTTTLSTPPSTSPNTGIHNL